MSVVIPRPAATVIVVRDSSATRSFDVLMVRRNDTIAFMGGAHVFPGGRVDDSDAAAARGHLVAAETVSRFPDLTAETELVYRLAAVRELEEEVGIRVKANDLVPFGHWVTPEIETRRYDTRFFLIEIPAGQEAQHDEEETTALVWLSPTDAIDRCRRGDIMLPPPTWTTLKRFSRFASIPAAFAWAHAARIVTIQPALIRDEHQTMLTLPGDPTYPPIDGWEVPEETRFLLQDGRWRPIPV